MVAITHEIEPLAARAGDTWQWTRTLSDYPAPSWVLSYTLFSAAAVVTITAAASGADHAVHVAPAVTALYTAGRYDWIASVTDGTDRYQVGSGSLRILPNLASATAFDGRTHARRMLDAIEATLEGRGTGGDLDVIRTTLGDQTAEYDPATLIKLHARYAAMVAEEDRAAAVGRGAVRSGMIQVQFR